jgi:hypothetical protein
MLAPYINDSSYAWAKIAEDLATDAYNLPAWLHLRKGIRITIHCLGDAETFTSLR